MTDIKIKVCGMRDAENIRALAGLLPDYIGFIFYEGSPRFANGILEKDTIQSIPESIEKVGVFVDSEFDYIDDILSNYGIKTVQLHGDESADYCSALNEKGYTVIKAFSIHDQFDFSTLIDYVPHCDYFLFDTKGENPGGNSISFDWKLLEQYKGSTPFFLSGGIRPDDIEAILKIQGLNLHAIDVNSKFEIEPGLKDISKLALFLNGLKGIS